MIRILFGKCLDTTSINSEMGKDFECDVLELISTETLSIPATDITNSHLIFTSKNAVLGFIKNGFQSKNNPLICVGSKTKAALEQLNLKPDFCFSNAEDALQHIKKHHQKGDEFVHFSGNLTLDTLENGIKDLGYNYQKIEVYRTQLLYPKVSKNYDAIVFFSPSGVDSFFKNNEAIESHFFCLGNTTANALTKYNVECTGISPNQQLDLLLEFIKKYYDKK